MSLVASSSSSGPTATFRRGIKSELLETGSTIIRIHHKDNGAIWFGPKPGLPPAYRFDAPAAEYRTMYAAVAIEGAFVETILHGKTEEQLVSRAYVEQRAWTKFATLRPFKLMKLYDEGLFWHGTDASISAVPSYTMSRQIALAAFREGADLDGIAYRSRHDNGELCFASSTVSQAPISTLAGPSRFTSNRIFAIHSCVGMAQFTTTACPFRRRRKGWTAELHG